MQSGALMSEDSLLYIADPMCSWCWGFAPVVQHIRDVFREQLPVMVIMGGLRPGTTEAMDKAMKEKIKGHWEQVGKVTGQPFDLGFFERDGFVYDTEPASRAVITVRSMDPDMAHLYLERVQRAFYAENMDITDGAILCELAKEAEVNVAQFERLFASVEMKAETLGEFESVQKAGISGFPTLIAGSSTDGYGVITSGYRPKEHVEEIIKSWFETRTENSE
jgi:putative protein-disulfide isomerase